MTDDSPGEFRAPMFQKATPTAIKAAGRRLVEYALLNDVPSDIAICDMTIPDDLVELRRDQRLLAWYVFELEGEP